MTQPPIPHVDPVEHDVWAPSEWLVTTGAIRWHARSGGGRCEDCLHCILDHVLGKTPAGTRPPGLARQAVWTRIQAKRRHIFCDGHAKLRRQQEGAADGGSEQLLHGDLAPRPGQEG